MRLSYYVTDYLGRTTLPRLHSATSSHHHHHILFSFLYASSVFFGLAFLLRLLIFLIFSNSCLSFLFSVILLSFLYLVLSIHSSSPSHSTCLEHRKLCIRFLILLFFTFAFSCPHTTPPPPLPLDNHLVSVNPPCSQP
jgi:hypothetical protein